MSLRLPGGYGEPRVWRCSESIDKDEGAASALPEEQSLSRLSSIPGSTYAVEMRALRATLALLLLLTACNKSQAPSPATTINSLDHVDAAQVQPINFLHKTFALKKTASFEFRVPAHTALPRLHGTFRSFIARAAGEAVSDDSADVDLVVLNGDQYADFTHGHSDGTALYAVDPTHDHEVDFLLSPTQEDSVTYYLLFRNRSGGAPSKQVQAEFSLNFGY